MKVSLVKFTECKVPSETKEFSFARKIGALGEHEVEALKEFSDSFAPNYYNHVVQKTDQVTKSYLDMEYFNGNTFADYTSKSGYHDVFSGKRMDWKRDVRYQIEKEVGSIMTFTSEILCAYLHLMVLNKPV